MRVVEFRYDFTDMPPLDVLDFDNLAGVLAVGDFEGYNSVRYSGENPGVDGTNVSLLLSLKHNTVRQLVITIQCEDDPTINDARIKALEQELCDLFPNKSITKTNMYNDD